MFDILIVTAPKDYDKLPFVLDSIDRNVTGFKDIYIISPTIIPHKYPDIIYHLDKDVIDFDFSGLTGRNKGREGWYKQQFIKLFQNVTSDDYLVVDSDVYFNRPINIIENDKPSFLLGQNQYHEAYFKTMVKVFGFGKCYEHSFINEVMYFKRNIINGLIDRFSNNGENLYQSFKYFIDCINEIDDPSGFSEFETYGNFVTKNFPEAYNYKHLKTHSEGKHKIWTVEEYINKYKDQDFDLLKMHTWL